MRKLLATALIIGFWLITPHGGALAFDAQQRARELAAAFSKTKHKVKERHGIRKELFREIRSEPVVKTDAGDYSGTYEADHGLPLRLQVGSDGRVEGNGAEPGANGERRFTLRDARVAGALLRGTKVYDDGTTGSIEGVFINRTERHSPTDSGTTTFGLGVLYDPPIAGAGYSIGRLFYQAKQ